VLDPKQPDSLTSSTQELNNDLALPSHTACDTTEIPDFPFQLKLNPSNANPRTDRRMITSFEDTLPPQTWACGIYSPSNLWSTGRPNPPNPNPETTNFPEPFSNPLASNFWLGTEDFESWWYMSHHPQPLVIPNSLRGPRTLSSVAIGILIVKSSTKSSILLFMITDGFLKIRNVPFESSLETIQTVNLPYKLIT
jgi:hypothetical protein